MINALPRVTVGMPVHNGGTMLATAIESLLTQTYCDFELIISDNGSSDDTPDVCRAFASQDARVQYHRYEENRGAAWNFNNVFHLSRGEYFRWAAADDLCAPSYLARCVEVLDDDPAIIWCHSRSRRIDPEGRLMPPPHNEEISYVDADPYVFGAFDRLGESRSTRESPRPHQRLRAVLLGQHGNVDVFGLVRADAMRKTSLQLPVYGGDKVFIAELSLMGVYQEIQEVLFFKRIHPSGSGAIASACEQQRWVDPTQSARGIRLRLLRAYVRAIRRTPIRASDQALCYAVLARYLFQIQKWRSIAVKTIRRAGTGGSYVAAMHHLEAERRTDVPDFAEESAETRDGESIGA